MRAEIGPENPQYSFPPHVLKYLRFICPGNVKGEFRDDAYVVSNGGILQSDWYGEKHVIRKMYIFLKVN